MENSAPRSAPPGSRSVWARSQLLRSVSGKFGMLLIALIALMAATPVIISGPTWNAVLSVFTSIVLVTSLHAVRSGWKMLTLGIVLALADFVIGRCAAAFPERWLLILQSTLWLATLLFVTTAILESIFEEKAVTIETLQASLCVYLLLGLVGAFMFSLIDLCLPGSFQVSHGPGVDWADSQSRSLEFMRLFVFSYSTLSGASYSEITPATGFTSNAASLEAMTGQIYLAVVIARLVGLHSTPPPH